MARDPALERFIDQVGRQDVTDQLDAIGWSLALAPDQVVRAIALQIQEHKRFAASVPHIVKAQADANRTVSPHPTDTGKDE